MIKITDINAALDPQFVGVDTPRTEAVSVSSYFIKIERELAEAKAEIVRLKGEAESWEQVFDRTCQLLADAKTEIAEATKSIVQECASIIKDAVDHREPASTYADKIKKHFGVEE
jgi:hypothetical protein